MLLDPADPLPARPRRVLVAGTSGSGKTTLAAELSVSLGIPHVEIDGLYHGQGWVPRASFVSDVEAFATQDAWVTEWQYSAVRGLLASRADLVVWLDLPRRTVIRQVVARTVRRRTRREVLWNGNTEDSLLRAVFHPTGIVRWAWSTHHKTSTRVAALDDGLPVVRLRNRAECGRWLAGPVAELGRRAQR